MFGAPTFLKPALPHLKQHLFVHPIFIVRQVLGAGFTGLLLEETHQMARIRKMEFVGQLGDSAVGEKQVVLQGFQQPLFQQVVGRNAELGHYCIVQGNAADVHHLGIFGNPLYVVNMPFEQVLELIGVIVLGYVDRQVVDRSVFTVDYQQQVIQ